MSETTTSRQRDPNDTASPDLNIPAPEGTWDNRATRRLKAKTARSTR